MESNVSRRDFNIARQWNNEAFCLGLNVRLYSQDAQHLPSPSPRLNLMDLYYPLSELRFTLGNVPPLRPGYQFIHFKVSIFCNVIYAIKFLGLVDLLLSRIAHLVLINVF